MREKEHLPILGHLIKQKVEEQGLSITEFAQKIHTSRRTVYEIFQKDNIDTELLHRISKILGSDWIVEYFIQKYKYNVQKNEQYKHLDTGHSLIQFLTEFTVENKRILNEIKALQHLILEQLEKKKV